MKKVILSIIAICFLSGSAFSQDAYEPTDVPPKEKKSRSSKGGITFNGGGAGAHVSLVLAEDWPGVLPAAAFGFGAQGNVEFKLGHVGSLQYYPSLQLWFRSDDDPTAYWDVRKTKDGMVAFNIMDFKYLFPLPEDLIFRPYAGFGPTILIHTWGNEYIHHEDTTPYEKDENSDSDADAGFNLFAGVDFKVTPVLVPFMEVRFTASDKNVFRLTGGLTVSF